MLQKIEYSLSKQLKIVIVEDEPLISATIETALSKAGHYILGDAEHFSEALSLITKKHPDLVLVDIQIQGQKDGIDLGIELEKLAIPFLYLTSQTDPDTIERVKKTQPLGYIVKPFTESGLQSNVELAWHNYSKVFNNTLLIKDSGRYIKVNQNDIGYLKAFDNYCYIITKQKEYLVPHTLKHTSIKLNNDDFIKAHRSYVVNINHIESIQKNSILVMGNQIPLSNSNKIALREKMGFL